MSAAAIAVMMLAVQAPDASGVAVERTVRRTSIDWLGKHEEVQRKELLLIRGSNLVLRDLTFGDLLIVRGDLHKVWKVDPLAREYAELTFDEVAALRKAALDDVRAAKARVPGTLDEKELESTLEGFDQFPSPPRVELRSSGAQRELILNGDRVRISVQVDDRIQAPGWMEALSAIGGFHPSVSEKLRELGGVPSKGTLRYVLFLDRIIEQFEATSIRRREIPDSEFELPAGLVRTPLRGFEPPAERKFSKPPTVTQSFKEDEGDKTKADGGENKKR